MTMANTFNIPIKPIKKNDRKRSSRHDTGTRTNGHVKPRQVQRRATGEVASGRDDASGSTAWKRQQTCGTACGGERPGTLGGRGGGKPPRELWHPRCSFGDFVETTVARKRVRVRTIIIIIFIVLLYFYSSITHIH